MDLTNRFSSKSALALLLSIAAAALALVLVTSPMPASAADLDAQAADIMERIDDCQTAINTANKTIKQAERDYKQAQAAADKAQAQVEEQEARIEQLRGTLEQLSVSLYKGHRSDNPLLGLLDAGSFEELDDALDSIETLADEEARLVEEARAARDELEKAKRSYDAQAEKAREQKAAAQKARKEAKKLHKELVAEAARIINEIADAEARRSLAEAIAEYAFDGELADMFVNPCPGATVSSGFGYRDFDNAFHQGLDMAAAEGTPYCAAAAGTVIYATNDGKDNGGAGNWVVIAHGNGLVTKYMHSKRTVVKVGDVVMPGQHIGDVGQTGAAFGAHLHFQVEINGTAVDPEKLIPHDGKAKSVSEATDAAADEAGAQQADGVEDAQEPGSEEAEDAAAHDVVQPEAEDAAGPDAVEDADGAPEGEPAAE